MNPSENQATRIGVAIVFSGDQLLVGVREAHQVLAGAHEFPGGKCLPDETPEQCAIRECQEETGLAVQVVELLDRRVHDYPHGRVEVSFFECITESNVSDPLLGNFRWIRRNELESCRFPEANRHVVDLILSRSPSRS